MAEYGIENVRGGSYSREHLSCDDEAALKKELIGASDSCFRCGRNNHFVSNCYASRHLDGHFLDQKPKIKQARRPRAFDVAAEEIIIDKGLVQAIESPQSLKAVELKMPKPCLSCKGDHDILDCPTKGQICYRCGSADHWKITCAATKDINGYPLEFEILGHVGATLKSWFW